jgi:hypothetical protein
VQRLSGGRDAAVVGGGLCRFLLGGRGFLGLFAGRKLCLGGQPGPTTVTPVGVASCFKALSKWVFLDLRPSSTGETIDPLRDRAWVTLLCRFASWGLALDVHRTERLVECFLVVRRRWVRLRPGGARPWGRCGSWSGVSGLSPPPVALRCGVDLVGRRPVWSAASGLA